MCLDKSKTSDKMATASIPNLRAFKLFFFIYTCLHFPSKSICLPQLNVTSSDLEENYAISVKSSLLLDNSASQFDLNKTENLLSTEDVNGTLVSDSPNRNESIIKPRPRMPIAKINFARVEIPVMIAIWVSMAIISKIGIQAVPNLTCYIPESCVLILIGILVGLILFYCNLSIISPLSSTIFFFCMLPPIIFDAGYFMPNRLFFDHLGTILLFAVVGTIFNTFTIGLGLWSCSLTGVYGCDIPLLEIFIFSALISAVDPVAVLAVFEEIHVDAVLYIIVFGESLLNDAVTVVLYNMFDSYITLGAENIDYTDILAGFASFCVVAIGGTSIGIVWGFLTGFATKFTRSVQVVEPVFIFIMSYLAYVNAETFQMSGILSIMFCGITMKNYVKSNVSPESYITITKALKMLSNTSETIIFIFLGINTVNDQHVWNTAFVLLTIFFCSLFRGLGVILLTSIANFFRLHQLHKVEKFVMSYGGLRGAIAFALVLSIDPNRIVNQPLFATTTISVVYFTVFFQGISMKPLVKFLKVKISAPNEKTMNERIHEKVIDYTMTGIEDVLSQITTLKYRDKFKQVNNHYIRPLVIKKTEGHEPKIFETYERLTMADALKIAHSNDFIVRYRKRSLGSVAYEINAPMHSKKLYEEREGIQLEYLPENPSSTADDQQMTTCNGHSSVADASNVNRLPLKNVEMTNDQMNSSGKVRASAKVPTHLTHKQIKRLKRNSFKQPSEKNSKRRSLTPSEEITLKK